MFDTLDESNFVLFAAKNYENVCYDTEEFYDDLKRFAYLRRLFGKYEEYNDLKERLIINHLIVLYNVFGESATRMLFFRLQGYHTYLKPFLVLLNRLPSKVCILDQTIFTSDIPLDPKIVEALRKI